MKVKIEEELCIGCGLCVNMADQIFEMQDDKAVVILAEVPADQEDGVREAIDSCAVEAIIIEE